MKSTRRLINIAGLRDIVERRIPVLTFDSKVPGPVVWVTGCVHGDEVGGTVIVHDVFKTLKKTGLKRGILHALPLINSTGFENISRYVNTEREDLNRSFPGDANGNMGQQIARRLFDLITKSEPTLVIDIHNDWIRSVPYILIEPAENYPTQQLSEQTLNIAHSTGLLLVEDNEVMHPLHNTLTGAIIDAGIAAFTIEAGGAFSVVEKNVEAGKTAVLSTLQQLDMIEMPEIGGAIGTDARLLRYTNQPVCSTSGLIRFLVAPGESVRRGQKLAHVYSAFGSREETLLARGAGYILGLNDHARVLPGREVIAIGEHV
jgi:predicted deacylase